MPHRDTVIVWRVSKGNIRAFVTAYHREQAKSVAHYWIGGDSDRYLVEPLTNPGDWVLYLLGFRESHESRGIA